jgi:hypothetical protein
MADISLMATNQDGMCDVRLYTVTSGRTIISPVFVTIYLFPIGSPSSSGGNRLSIMFI